MSSRVLKDLLVNADQSTRALLAAITKMIDSLMKPLDEFRANREKQASTQERTQVQAQRFEAMSVTRSEHPSWKIGHFPAT